MIHTFVHAAAAAQTLRVRRDGPDGQLVHPAKEQHFMSRVSTPLSVGQPNPSMKVGLHFQQQLPAKRY